jgi:parallel beta-helix repeat protein
VRKTIKIGLIIGITIAFLTPVSLVIADDTEPPVITSISYGPHAGVRTDPGFYLYQSCNVTDNVSVADVRINIIGPVGFTPINDSMVLMSADLYYYEVDNVSVSGTYEFYIWAIDTSNNSIQSAPYYMLVFENYLSYIHVDVNNTVGPWNGTVEYPLQYINDALAVLAPNGTIFIHDGVYANTSISLDKNMNFIGENQDMTILDGGGVNTSVIVQISSYSLITISNLTLRNAMIGIQAQNGNNSIVSHCSFLQCADSGIILSDYQQLMVSDCTFENNYRGMQLTNCSYNQFYHNNFQNNSIQVSTYFNTSSNIWDDGITGNYWDDYRISYPTAQIIPGTGTWDTPYIVNISGNNTDYHPWVYTNGYIDTIPPEVTVIYPNGGEVLAGEVMVQWSASDDVTMDLNGTILIEYSADNGSSWNQIAAQQNNTGLYLWNTSLVPDGDLYLIQVSATDEFLNVGSDTSNSTFSINNHLNYPPSIPQVHGPSFGGNEISFSFTANATDPEGELIYYKWDWGDGNVSGWLGPFNSSGSITMSYMWMNDGNYSVRVKAKDIGEGESAWSAEHLISIAPQINFSNVKLGYIYIKLFSFNRSFIFSDFLARLGVVIILTSHDMSLEGVATDVVKSVTFRAENQMQVETMEIIDDNSSDGFSCNMNVSRGIYTLNITAYDGNGSLVDRYSLVTVFFIRIGRYATGPGQSHLQRLRSIPRLRH